MKCNGFNTFQPRHRHAAIKEFGRAMSLKKLFKTNPLRLFVFALFQGRTPVSIYPGPTLGANSILAPVPDLLVVVRAIRCNVPQLLGVLPKLNFSAAKYLSKSFEIQC